MAVARAGMSAQIRGVLITPAPHPHMSDGLLHLGGSADDAFRIESSDLTTHGVIVGMTGSGKTGLGIILLEELLADGIPCLVLDPKGDMGNLLLNFPEFRPEDFEPWVDAGEAEREGITPRELAERTAGTWKSGLERAGIGPDRMREVRPGADIRILTPGSTAGIPMNLVGDLTPPPPELDPELRRDEIEGLVSGILVLAGLDVDPLTSREHILLSNLVEHGWAEGRTLDLATLIGWIHRPPIARLGVFDVETFFPEKDRLKLAMRLNGLVASPSFAEWMAGEPLDIDGLLHAPDGRPRASIVYLSHLSDRERLFVVARLLSKLITWMRTQPGTSELRALLYADEVAGFAPPTAEPPTKRSILTLYKQARAHGVGVVLATQNPMDLDYKIMSNAGTWMVGRLQTEGDKRRIIEGLRSASGDVNVREWDARIGELAKREFLVRRTRASGPSTFSTRWAMSYLRGPLARTELVALREEMSDTPVPADPGSTSAPSADAASTEGTETEAHAPPSPDAPAPTPLGALGDLAPDETPIRPEVADGVPLGWLNPKASWAGKLPSVEGASLEAGLAARIELLFDERRGDVRHSESWEAVFFPLRLPAEPREAFIVDYEPEDFEGAEPSGARYRIPEVDLDKITVLKGIVGGLEDFLHANRTLELFSNRTLKLVSSVGETREAFEERCLEAAEDRADEKAAALRKRYESRLATAQRKLREQLRKVEDLEATASARRQEEFLAGAGDVLSMFLGGRRRTRSLSGMARRRNRSQSVARRADAAAERVEEAEETIERIEADLAEELEALWAEWEEKAGEIESFEVGLEENDIRVTDMRVFFAPAAR